MNVLVGDIGGTKTILAVFSPEKGPRTALAEKTYPSAQYDSLEDITRNFLDGVDIPVSRACFAVAGPVVAGRAQITNLPWVVDSESLKTTFGFTAVALLNDLEAVAYAVPALQSEDVHTLSAGVPAAKGSIAVLAPGTGLGEAFLTYSASGYKAHASEGSHASFGPVGKLQIGLLEYMNTQGFTHVSYERVCSGGLGIPNLYAYLKNTGAYTEPGWLAEQMAASDDPTPVIFAAAHDTARPCPLAEAVVDLFVEILAVEAGNLALKILSTGGIYLGGGISPRILAYLQKPEFLKLLRSKGRFEQMLANIPVHVILNTHAGLLGAAVFGLNLPA